MLEGLSVISFPKELPKAWMHSRNLESYFSFIIIMVIIPLTYIYGVAAVGGCRRRPMKYHHCLICTRMSFAQLLSQVSNIADLS